MGLTNADKELIKMIVSETCREIIPELLESHVASCPHAKRSEKRWSVAVGIAVGISLVSGTGGGFALAKLLGV